MGRSRRKLTVRPEEVEDGVVAAYIRKSRIEWPDGCDSFEDRKAHVEMLRQTRKTELIADAARFGETITLWFDDLGISGTGKHLDKRVDYQSMREQANRGQIRIVFAREVSRLNRDFGNDDLFFTEMEARGVLVIASDLPTPSKNETREQRNSRTMTRRILAAVNQNDAERTSARVSSSLKAKFEKGYILGLWRHWGFIYNKEKHIFEIDEVVAPQVLRFFDIFIANGGNSSQTAAQLNTMILSGSPDAILPTSGRTWARHEVRRKIVSPIWDQEVTRKATDVSGYGIDFMRYYRPEMVPRIVPEETVAVARNLLSARKISERGPAKRRSFTYSSLCFCHYCGSIMRPSRNESGNVSYGCGAARKSRPLCPDSKYVSQARIDPTVGRALELLLERLQSAAYPPTTASAAPDLVPRGPSAADRLAALELRRQRLLDALEDGRFTVEDIYKRLNTIEEEQGLVRGETVETESVLVNPFDRYDKSQWPALVKTMTQYWQDEDRDTFQQGKSNLLHSFQTKVFIHTMTRPRVGKAPGKPAEVPGRLIARVEFGIFRQYGEGVYVVEFEEDEATYARHSYGNHRRGMTFDAPRGENGAYIAYSR